MIDPNLCVDCVKSKTPMRKDARLLPCADGACRCVSHRLVFIEHQHAEAARVAKRATGSVGEQASYL